MFSVVGKDAFKYELNITISKYFNGSLGIFLNRNYKHVKHLRSCFQPSNAIPLKGDKFDSGRWCDFDGNLPIYTSDIDWDNPTFIAYVFVYLHRTDNYNIR